MTDTTTIRVARATRDQLARLARQTGRSLADTVARGAQLVEQERMGIQLAEPLRDDEEAWLGAELG